MNLDKRLLHWLRAERWLLVLIGLLGLGGALLLILQARLLSGLLGAVFLESAGLEVVMPLLGTLLLIGLLRAIITTGVEIFSGRLAIRIKRKIRQMLLDRLLTAGPAYVQRENSGEVTNTFLNGVEALDAYYSQYLPQLILSAVVPSTILLAVFPLDWLSGLVFLLTAPLIPFFMMLVGKGSENMTRRQYQSLSRLSAFFLDTLQGLRELKQWNRSKDHAQRISKAAEDYRRKTMSVLRVTFLSALTLELVATISTAVVAVQIGLRLLYGLMDFQQAFMVLLLAPEFYQPLRLLGQRFHAGMSGVSAAERIFALLETVPPLSSPSFATPLLLKAGSVIRFENVSFQFQNRKMHALRNIHFELRCGEMLALVGSTGSGKTTIANLLMGFIQPTQGKIWIENIPLTEIDLSLWRKQIAWVGQQPFIFYGTLRENLLLAKSDAGTEELEQAISLARLDEVIRGLPQGIDTVLDEEGAKLSSGEAQRLALARAFLKNAPIVILDEPTAHLDAGLEKALEESIIRLCAGRTVLMIAHRLPTVMRANRILVLQDGEIVEQGTHVELISLNGYYTKLVKGYGG